MEKLTQYLMENATIIATNVMIILCYIFGKPKTAEKIKKSKAKQLAKTHKRSLKLVHALDVSNKKEEKLKKEIEENVAE